MYLLELLFLKVVCPVSHIFTVSLKEFFILDSFYIYDGKQWVLINKNKQTNWDFGWRFGTLHGLNNFNNLPSNNVWCWNTLRSMALSERKTIFLCPSHFLLNIKLYVIITDILLAVRPKTCLAQQEFTASRAYV